MVLDIDNYLRRINFTDDLQINHKTLAALHRKHLLNIPFENLDIHQGRKIHLNTAKLENKIVLNQRGGFCYELNGLFGALLKQLGFDVKLVSARVFGKEKIGREFDHLALVVTLSEEWLVDVGFGDNFLEPIRITPGLIQVDPTGYYKIEEHGEATLRLEFHEGGRGFSPKYLFSLQEKELGDFAEMCNYHQTSPDSSFTHGRICSMATSDGRITLQDHRFIKTTDGQKNERFVTNDLEFDTILWEKFSMKVR